MPASSNFSKYKVSNKTKKLQVWIQSCFIWEFLGRNLKKAIARFEINILSTMFRVKNFIFGNKNVLLVVMFEISILDFVKILSFTQKLKYLKLRPKMRYLGIFGV